MFLCFVKHNNINYHIELGLHIEYILVIIGGDTHIDTKYSDNIINKQSGLVYSRIRYRPDEIF